jgi:hypothetical protein
VTDINRRTSLKLLGAGGTALLASWPIEAQAQRAGIVLFDGRFEAARREAVGWVRNGAQAIDTRQEDIGHVWRGVVPDRLAESPAAVCGITLYVDQMISAMMGRELGLRLVHLRRDVTVVGAASLHRWVLA